MPPEYTAEENAHAKEVYAYYGLAMMQAQHLERLLVGMLIVFDLAPSLANYPHAERAAQFERLMAALDRKTLGQLISSIRTPETPRPTTPTASISPTTFSTGAPRTSSPPTVARA
jgi:hypothetical protein